MTDASPSGSPIRRRVGWFLLLATALALLLWFVWPAAVSDAAPRFVGSSTCAGCHAGEFRQWQQSHHHQAMQAATDASVLGDFNNASLAEGDAARFSRHGDTFVVRTTGPDGKPHDYPVRYTFGVEPLQQYLLELPGGRLQAFTGAWDSRPQQAGGQRWFALYPEASGKPADPLHWSAIDQNWNANCASCHTTDLRKNFDATTQQYATRFAEAGVGCEACHGPGSAHVDWAQKGQPDALANAGLTVDFGNQPLGSWHYDSQREEVVGQGAGSVQVETCATCHGLGTPLEESVPHGQPVEDHKRMALLDPSLYFPDGQIKGEVFEYGSFLQSRMYHAGVTCSNCHNPHSGELRAQGNAVCTQCHQSSRYDTSDHFHHPVGSAGAQCVACHMPSRTYMGVDVRHDHSLRVPRPDLSTKLGSPNACNQCHSDKSADWAAAAIASWPNGGYQGYQQFAEAIWAGREGAPGATTSLVSLLNDSRQPAIARATALALLLENGGAGLDGASLHLVAKDASPLLRRTAAEVPQVAASLLDDPVRSVRISAARTLAASPASAAETTAGRELEQALNLSTDRPETHVMSAGMAAARGDMTQAENELRAALSLDSAYVPALVNLADLYRSQGQEVKANKLLADASQRLPKDASLHYAAGLAAIRAGQPALDELAAANRLAPDNAQFAYVYALALVDEGRVETAMQVLQSSLQQNPWHRPSLALLARLQAH